MLEEVVVTAQRHEETAQRTAVSMSVYFGENLVTQGVKDVVTLTTIDPSINITNVNGNGYVAIRGVTSADITEIGDPAVSISRDGFFYQPLIRCFFIIL